MEENINKFNKPPVYGQWIDVKERLPEEEQDVLVVQQKFGNRCPVIYAGELENGKWTIYHWEGVTKDADNNPDFFWVTHWMPLPPSPGSVDVEEKQDPAFLLAVKKKMPLSERLNTVSEKLKSVKEVSREGEIAELHEKLEEITFYEEEARRQIGIRDQLLEDIFYNRLKPEVIKHKIDQILNLPF